MHLFVYHHHLLLLLLASSIDLSIYLSTEQVGAKTTIELSAAVLVAHRTGTPVQHLQQYLKRRSDDGDDKVGNSIKKGTAGTRSHCTPSQR